jgi:DNA-binding NarL/FixJ family response regulator
MQDALRHSNGSGNFLDESRDQKAIDSPSGSVRVKLLTDRAWVASRLARLLGDASGIEILDHAGTDPAASGLHSGQPAAVLVLDCTSFAPQERMRLQRTAHSHYPARVLWFLDVAPSTSNAVRSVRDAVKAGWCHGYIVDDCPFDTIVRAIAAVARHDFWLPRAMLVRALSESEGLRARFGSAVAAVRRSDRARTLLTMRERQILQLVRRGLTNKEVGRHLGIEEDTVKKHLRNMYAKLGVHRRAQMLLRCVGEARA